MSLSKPYYRIARPKANIYEYATDARYAIDRLQLSRAYVNIEKSLRDIFNFIEPCDENLTSFSFELYTLLLRSCTEVELNCKEILQANGAKPQGKHFTMLDYKKIEQSSHLSKYTVTYNNWRHKDSSTGQLEYVSKTFRPFQNFDSSIATSPDWYVAYNGVKHDREGKLENANLENCMNAVGGILVLLYSQFGSQCIETYGTNGIYWEEMVSYDFHFDADVIFSIQPPPLTDWTEQELYDFQWNDIKSDACPFNQFPF